MFGQSVSILSVFFCAFLIGTKGILLKNDQKIKVFTVATENTEGYQRYIRSGRNYGIEIETLGMGTNWMGGDMNYLGGGYKVNLLKTALEPLKHDKEQIVLFTDSYDVMFLSTLQMINEKFRKFDANVVFGAEHFCWPNNNLKDQYPEVAQRLARFLNSGLFIGFASDLAELLNEPILDTDDDQAYYTNIYLNEELRDKHKIKLDHKSEIFQNLNGALSQIKLDFDYLTGESFIMNLETQMHPSIIHGNGPSKLALNSLGNYISGTFSNGQCHICDENNLELDDNNLPTITLGVFIEKPMPFLEEFFDTLLAIDYPKSKLKLFLHNAIEYHSEIVNSFIKLFGKEYSNIKTILPSDNVEEVHARNLALTYTQQKECDYLFVIDAEARLDNSKTLRELLKYNRAVIAPLLVRPDEVWSNYWGALNDQGYYARSHDYMDIVKNVIRGLWNVPFISSCYLIKKQYLKDVSYDGENNDAELSFTQGLRAKNIFMHVVNVDYYGHLINAEEYNIQLKNPDFYMLATNRPDWEQRYIHPEYVNQLQPNVTHLQPCTDVFWFRIATDRFCDELVEIMEHYGKWSDGTNQDSRLKEGYEAVPTRDIHMNQVGLEPMWLNFLKSYIRPLQEAVFTGYYHNPPRSLMNFVVRYKPDEQPYLRPHHDSSTYTINIALNRAGVDYEGGGCRFLRYNCSVADTKKGWLLMHPGRLTHFHEGMMTTKGTRYIMISFVDP